MPSPSSALRRALALVVASAGLVTVSTAVSVPAASAAVTPAGKVVSVQRGTAVGAFLTENGDVWTWGDNSAGATGQGLTSGTTTLPTKMADFASGGEKVVQIALAGLGSGSTASAFGLALTDGGTVYSWGYDGDGALGNDAALVNASSPVEVSPTWGSDKPVTVAIAGAGARVITAAGHVYAWGDNEWGQTAIANGGADITTPQLVTALDRPADPVVQITGGSVSMTVLTQDGVVLSAGSKSRGRRGDGTSDPNNFNTYTPALGQPSFPGLTGGDSIVSIGTGTSHTIAVSATGKVWGWGLSTSGRLGADFSSVDQTTPVQIAVTLVDSGDQVASVEIGPNSNVSYLLTAQGHLYSAGGATGGILGNGQTSGSYASFGKITTWPTRSAGDPIVEAVVGASGAEAVTASGLTFAWGNRDVQGGIGLSGTGIVSTPTVLAEAVASAEPFWSDGDVGIVGAESGTAIRKVSLTGTVSDLGTTVRIRGGAIGRDGNLYLQDATNATTRLLKITPDGTQSVLATSVLTLTNPPTTGDVEVLPDGDLMVAAYRNPTTAFARVDVDTGAVTQIYSNSSTQSGARAGVSGTGDIYYLTTGTSPKAVWKLAPIAGATPTKVLDVDLAGAYDLAVDVAGNLYVHDNNGLGSANRSSVVKYVPQSGGGYTGTEIAQSPTVGDATNPAPNAVGGITVDGDGRIAFVRHDGSGNIRLYRASSSGTPATNPVSIQTVTQTNLNLDKLTSLPGDVPTSVPFTDAVDASVSGTVQVGESLTASGGTYAPADATLAYVWKVGSDTVSTTSSYTPKLADAGKTLKLTVTGSKAGYDDSVSTTAGETVATIQGFTGTVKAGETLTASDNSGTNTWGLSSSSSCTAPSTSTGATFDLPGDSAGKYVQLSQTIGSRTGSGTCVGPIAAAQTPASITGAATAQGVTGQSFTYTPTVGGTPAPTVTVVGSLPTGVTVDDETGELSGTPTQVGLFEVTLRADNGVGSPADLDLDITILDVVTGLTPTVSSDPAVGATMTASPGGSLAPAGATVAYQWQYESAPGTWTDLASATSASYTPGPTEVGRVFRIRVTVSKTGYQTKSATSDATAATVEGTFTVGTPELAGTAEVGQTLTCAAPSGTQGTKSYVWTRGATEVGTGLTYVLTPEDRTHVVRCTMTVARDGYVDATGFVESATVDYGTFTVGTPELAGTAEVGQTLTCAAPSGTQGTKSYVWTRGATEVGTGLTYVLTPEDRTHVVRCTMTVARDGYVDATGFVESATVDYGTFTVGTPELAGTAEVGQTLTCAAPSGTQGTKSYVWTRGATEVGTGLTYVLTPDDRTHVVRCTMTVHRDGYTDVTGFVESATVDYGTFTVGAPLLGGTAEVGQTLTCAAQIGTPGTKSYEWTRGATVLGAGLTYVLTPDDRTHVVRCTMTAQRDGYVDATSYVESATVGYGTFTVGAPLLGGTAEVGQTLTCAAQIGTPGTKSYEWTRGATVLGTGLTYVLTPDDRTHVVRCTMTAQRDGYTDATSFVESATVDYGTFTVGTPELAGTAEVGQTLTCAAPSGTQGTKSYVWTRGATEVGTGLTYVLTPEDRTHVVTCTMTVHRDGYTDATNTVDSATVDYGTFTVGTPELAGTAEVGQTLTCAAPAGTQGTKSYVWTRGATEVGTGLTYVLTPDDRTHVVTCTMTVHRDGYTDATNTVDSATVDYGTFTIGVPEISGTAQVGQSLTCAPAAGTLGTVSYAWTRGATELGSGATYELTADDRTHEVTCTVTSTRDGYIDATNTVDSATVDYGVLPSPEPTISGTPRVGEELTCAVGEGVDVVDLGWSRGGIPVGSGATYQLTADDVDAVLTCIVTVAREGYLEATGSSEVGPIGDGLFIVAAPTITGVAQVGQQLVCATPAAGEVGYAWTRDGVAVGSGPVHDVTPEDLGAPLTCTITVARPGYEDASASATSDTVQPGAAGTYEVELRGRSKVGVRLRAAVADLPDDATVAWAWLRDDRPIGRADAARYRLRPADLGARVTAVATVTLAGYDDATATARSAKVGLRRLTLQVDPASVHRGHKVRVTIGRLLPGERWTLALGTGRVFAEGVAGKQTISRRVRIPGDLPVTGKRHLNVRAPESDRKRAVAFRLQP